MSQIDVNALMAALQQLNSAQPQIAQGQQRFGMGQQALQGAQRQLAQPTGSVGGVAGRASPFQALGAGLMGGAGIRGEMQGMGQQQAGYGAQQQGQQALQMQLSQLLRQQQAQGGSMAPGNGTDPSTMTAGGPNGLQST